ncbi:MAG: M1 family aminopeptidase [Thermoplasmata archaeon]
MKYEFEEEYKPFPFPYYKKRYERDRSFRQEHISVELYPNFEKKEFYAIEEIKLKAIFENLDLIQLDAYEMNIQEILVDEKNCNFIYDGKTIVIKLDKTINKGDEVKIKIKYSTKPRRGIFFIGPDEYYPEKPVQLWSQGEDEDTRYWLPCYDYPNERTTTEIKIVLPEGFNSISNGILIKDEKIDGNRIMHWKEDFPHPIYLISIVAGKFYIYEDEIDGVKVQYAVPEGKENLIPRSFVNTPDMIRYFNRLLNYPYPYKKYSQTVVNDFIFGGMENLNSTTLTEFTLHDDKIHNDYMSEGLVSHELAHQWFGDLITCRDWSHAWLNEGFATYMNAVYFEHFLGHDDFLYQLYLDELNYKNEFSTEYARPIVTNVYEYPGELFDRHLYEKASRVLHMLRDELGENTFWSFINKYLITYAGRSIDTYDFINLLKEYTGKSMDFFFDQWIFHAGHPILEASYKYDYSKGILKLRIEQKQEGKEIPDVFNFKMKIAFYVKGRRELKEIRVNERIQEFDFNIEYPEGISLDPENTILKDLKFERPESMLITQIRQGTPMEAIEAIIALGKKGGLNAISILKEISLSDKFWAVRKEAIISLGKMKTEQSLNALLEIKKEILRNRIVDSRIRSALSDAFGNYTGNSKALEALEEIISNEKKYYPISKAFESVGKLKHEKSNEILYKGLSIESWNEIIRQGVIKGYGELGDFKSFGILLENSKLGKHVLLRAASVLAIGKIGEGKKEVLPWRYIYLRDPYLQVRRAAVQAIYNVGLPDAIGELENVFNQELDAHIKRAIRKTINDITKGLKEKDEIKNLRNELDEIRKKLMELYDKVGK